MAKDYFRYYRTGSIRFVFAAAALTITAISGTYTVNRKIAKFIMDTSVMNTPVGERFVLNGAYSWEKNKCHKQTQRVTAQPDQRLIDIEKKADVTSSTKVTSTNDILDKIDSYIKTANEWFDSSVTWIVQRIVKVFPSSWQKEKAESKSVEELSKDEHYVNCLKKEIGSKIVSPETAGLIAFLWIVGLFGLSNLYRSIAFLQLGYKTQIGRPFFKFKPVQAAKTQDKNSAHTELADRKRDYFIPTFKIGDGSRPIVTAHVPPEQAVYAERGALLARTDGVTISSAMVGKKKSIKNVGNLITRMFSGEGAFLTKYANPGARHAEVHLNAGMQTIVPTMVDAAEGIIVRRGSFFAASSPLDIRSALIPDFSFIVLGGQGMFLQSIVPAQDAAVLLESPGQVLERKLAADEVLRVQATSFLGMTPSVSIGLSENKGVFKRVGHGEERFDVALKGPGTVWIQTERVGAEKGWFGKFLPG